MKEDPSIGTSQVASLPRAYISFTAESKGVADALTSLLEEHVTIVRWRESIFQGAMVLETILAQVADVDFLICVLSPDDIISSQDVELKAPRDNVVFELGLFMGGLGRDRCLVVGPNVPIKIPADLVGLIRWTYPVIDGTPNLEDAAVGMATIIHRMGHRPQLDGSAAALRSVATADPGNIQQVAAADLALSTEFYYSALSQADRSFTAAIRFAMAGSAFYLLAGGVALTKHGLDRAIISAIAGGLVQVIAGLLFWLYSRTSEQRTSFHLRLDRAQRFLLANSVCQQIESLSERDATRTELVRRLVSEDVSTPSAPPIKEDPKASSTRPG